MSGMNPAEFANIARSQFAATRRAEGIRRTLDRHLRELPHYLPHYVAARQS